MEDIILLGCGGHSKSIVDSIESGGLYKIVGFLDNKKIGTKCYKDYEILGNDDNLREIYQRGIKNAFIAIGYLGTSEVRMQIYKRLKNIGYTVPNIIDKTAIIAEDVKLGQGNFIGKGAIINSNAVVGDICILNTRSVVEHDCIIEDNVHIAVGSILCGSVTVKSNSFIGANSVIIQGINVGNNVIAGAGSTVIKDINNNAKFIQKRSKI